MKEFQRYFRMLHGPLAALGLAVCKPAWAGCAAHLPVVGALTVERCIEGPACVSAAQALYEYAARGPGRDDPTVLNNFLHSSPWRFYDQEMRIIPVEELADSVRPYRNKGVRRVVLKASWSGVAPGPKEKSLAARLSSALGGVPVQGQDGFVWMAADGSLRTTRQALSVMSGSGPYQVKKGGEVLVALVASWPTFLEDSLRQAKDAEGLLHAGAGADIFLLCPDQALRIFDEAASLGSPIAAYNGALMRLDRGAPGDRLAALRLLEQAAQAEDRPARELLNRLAR